MSALPSSFFDAIKRDNDIITIYSKSQGTHNYYDRLDAGINGTEIKPLGQFMAVKVGGDEWSS